MKKIMSYFNLLPLSFKLILGFTVICVIIIFFMTVAAFFNRPNQIQNVNVNIRMYNFDDVQCTVIPSVAYGFVTGMNLQLC